MTVQVLHGDCLEVLRGLDDCSVDAVVCDPPYGLSNTKPAQVADVLKAWATGDDTVVPEARGFMNAAWDGFVPPPAVWKECMRVLKPGGHMAVFAGARTQDLMGLSIRLAGFDIRDGLSWITGSGFPKGQDIGKQIDKMKGAKREVVGRSPYAARRPNAMAGSVYEMNAQGYDVSADLDVTAPATDEARKWDGWNTQLKPAQEPIILARKPLDGTVAGNVLAWGVGGLNIDASRVGMSDADREYIESRISGFDNTRSIGGNGAYSGGQVMDRAGAYDGSKGRFPANVLLDEHAAAEMDKQSGITKSTGGNATHDRAPAYGGGWDNPGANVGGLGDTGGASRFFPVFKYQAKAPKRERPVIEREDGSKIQHPTVKPVALMEWLVTLITPPGGVVLDPFAGSGTTLEAARNKGFSAIGIEQEADYIQLINKRLEVTPSTLND